MKLVLLPGLDGTGVLFKPFLEVLPRNIEPLVINYPTQTPLGYDELFELVRPCLPSNAPFVLVGESFGGPLALRIAATSPTGLRGVVLAGSFISCPYGWTPHWASSLVTTLPFRAVPYTINLQSLLGMYESSAHRELSYEALSQVAPSVFAHRVREIICVDATQALRDCPVPILYLQATRDAVVPAANYTRIASIRPDVSLARINSGHMIFKTQPNAALTAIQEFIARLGD
jgi:pimeloyl-[acyl-carrier protein] methyl ester esterase